VGENHKHDESDDMEEISQLALRASATKVTKIKNEITLNGLRTLSARDGKTRDSRSPAQSGIPRITKWCKDIQGLRLTWRRIGAVAG